MPKAPTREVIQLISVSGLKEGAKPTTSGKEANLINTLNQFTRMIWQTSFFEIDLNKVATLELQIDPNWQSSHGYSREQMQQWVQQLSEIQRLRREQGYTHVDFQQMRQSSNLGDRAIGETYHKFYDHAHSGPEMNHDYVAVEWIGDRYQVINGRHRVWLAQQMGLRHLPARVSAPDSATLTKLKADGEQIFLEEKHQLTQTKQTQPLKGWEKLEQLKAASCHQRQPQPQTQTQQKLASLKPQAPQNNQALSPSNSHPIPGH